MCRELDLNSTLTVDFPFNSIIYPIFLDRRTPEVQEQKLILLITIVVLSALVALIVIVWWIRKCHKRKLEDLAVDVSYPYISP